MLERLEQQKKLTANQWHIIDQTRANSPATEEIPLKIFRQTAPIAKVTTVFKGLRGLSSAPAAEFAAE